MHSIFSGRYNRSKYFWRSLLVAIPIAVAAEMLSSAFLARAVLYLLAMLALSPMAVKRLHDVDMSGWYYLLFFVPVANVVFGFYLLFGKGTQGPNRFGPDPITATVESEIERNIERLFKEAVKLEVQGRHGDALLLYRRIVHDYPSSRIAWDAQSCIQALERKEASLTQLGDAPPSREDTDL